MRLNDWLKRGSVPRREFADRMGVTVSALSGWCRGDRTPSGAHIAEIEVLTKGEVLATDFVNGAAPPVRRGRKR